MSGTTPESTIGWLLVRGLSRDRRHWGGFAEQFAADLGVRVATVDAPGFGTEHTRLSPASIPAITDDIRARFDPGDTEWSILGLSLGGMVALDWITRYPKDFQRCVTVNTAAPRVFRPHYLRLEALRVFAGKTWRTPDAHESAIIALSANSPDLDRPALAAEWARFHHEAPASEASVRAQVRAATTFQLPRTIPVPLLVLAATKDRLADHRMSRSIATQLDAPLRLHPTAGHDLPLDDGPWITAQIRQWTAEPSSEQNHGPTTR